MPYYTKAGEPIKSGCYAAVESADKKGWTWWPVVVFRTKWDVWGHLRHVIVEEPEDFSHVIVFYVGSEGITEKCSYEIVNVERICHEDGISYSKMLRHAKEDTVKRDLAEAIYNREVHRETGSKDMKAVKEIYRLFKMKYQDPAEKRAALKRDAKSGEVQCEKGPRPSASAATGASRADAKRKRSAKPRSSNSSSKKKGPGSASSGRRQSSRVEQSDSDEDSDTDVEPDACKKTQTSRISNRSSGKKAQSEASSPMLTRSASTLNGPRGAPSTATEAAMGGHGGMDIDDNDEQDDGSAFVDDSLSGGRKPIAPPAAARRTSDTPSTPTATLQVHRDQFAMAGGARTKTRQETTPPARAMPPPVSSRPIGEAPMTGRRADEVTRPQDAGGVESAGPSFATPEVAKGTRAFADGPSALASAIAHTTASPEAPNLSGAQPHETQRGGSAADRSSGQGDHGKQNEASISLKEGKEGQKKEAGQEVKEQAEEEKVGGQEEEGDDDLCIITEVRPLKLDPDLMEVVKCLASEAFERVLRLGDEQSKLVWRTLDQMRSGTSNAKTRAMTDFLVNYKLPTRIAIIMKDPSQIELTLECAAWALSD